MIRELEKAIELAKENDGAYIIKGKGRGKLYELVGEEEQDYFVNFIGSHELIKIVK